MDCARRASASALGARHPPAPARIVRPVDDRSVVAPLGARDHPACVRDVAASVSASPGAAATRAHDVAASVSASSARGRRDLVDSRQMLAWWALVTGSVTDARVRKRMARIPRPGS